MAPIFLIFAITGIFVLAINVLFKRTLGKITLTERQKCIYKPLFKTPFGRLIFLIDIFFKKQPFPKI
jgi:hypothetical protein